jgi:hypothetical protein
MAERNTIPWPTPANVHRDEWMACADLRREYARAYTLLCGFSMLIALLLLVEAFRRPFVLVALAVMIPTVILTAQSAYGWRRAGLLITADNVVVRQVLRRRTFEIADVQGFEAAVMMKGRVGVRLLLRHSVKSDLLSGWHVNVTALSSGRFLMPTDATTARWLKEWAPTAEALTALVEQQCPAPRQDVAK